VASIKDKMNAMNEHVTTSDDFFSACYLQYYNSILKYIASRIYHSYDAEDLTQDVFLRLWEYRTFVNKDTVCSLLYTIARNLIIDKIRIYNKKEIFVSYIYNVQEAGRNTVDEYISSSELEALHHQVVNSLPDKRRLIYKLVYDGMTTPVIASRLNLSTRTIEGQLLLARRKVRSYIKQQLVS
jgi:RNA polymerase sigma factor (sigma-70 family)